MLTIKTDRLVIREWNIPDANQFFPLSQDPGLNEGPLPPFRQESLPLAEKKIIDWALTFGQTKMGILPIFLAPEKTLIGLCGIKPRVLEKNGPMQFEVICQIARDHQKSAAPDLQSDLGVEALQAILRYGFKDLGLHEMISLSVPELPAVRKNLEKSGMVFLKSLRMRQKPVDVFHVSAQ